MEQWSNSHYFAINVYLNLLIMLQTFIYDLFVCLFVFYIFFLLIFFMNFIYLYRKSL